MLCYGYSTGCLLYTSSLNTLSIAMLLQKESVAVELLNKYHVPFDEIKKELSEEKSLLHELDLIHELTNFNHLVQKQERLMIGRDQELEQLFLTLCKKEKNNALLIGKAGVGKTALVEKLALKINSHEVPAILKDKVCLLYTSCWSAFTNIPENDWHYYLQYRKRQGYNVDVYKRQ